MDNFVILTGCSGGGKSTLLAELARRGLATVEEPGRRIVRHQQAISGRALPWIDLAAFAQEAIRLGREDRRRMAGHGGRVFFDRSLIDATSALAIATGDQSEIEALRTDGRYHHRVFAVAPWPEIFVEDQERRHDFAAAVEEYERLGALYADPGYTWTIIPKASIAERADFVLRTLEN
ncbi:AAA family ATPase [Peteryoungia ipomoeae]|uniref:ATPase n=1 Tax=Peteryoungia ipomoeae TaxID=1210932 RepID=A0A4V4HMA2_9HYPH|nr:AAA family ATPase [Peteryoungia ipomoeae]THV21396.1 ATPase [Peteryoungia ipomoeae]